MTELQKGDLKLVFGFIAGAILGMVTLNWAKEDCDWKRYD